MVTRPVHRVPRAEAVIGRRVRAVCGFEFTVSEVNPSAAPRCRNCFYPRYAIAA